MDERIQKIARTLKLTNLDNNPNFSFIENTLGVKPSAVIIAVLVFLTIVTLISSATSIVIAVGCCCVPAYLTFTVIQSEEWEQIKKYLIYWILYAILEVMAPVLSFALPSTLYIMLRIGIAVALIHPQSSIGLNIYDNFISPFLEKHEKRIDRDIKKAVEKGKNILQKGKDIITQQFKEI